MALSCWCCGEHQVLSFAEGDSKVHPDPNPEMSQLRIFSLEELQLATDYFSDENFLGRGGFGKVYKGRLDDGSLIAVKRLEREITADHEIQFQITTQIVKLVNHPNVITLLGFCRTRCEKLLVYPYMVNGSVASHLKERAASQPPLNWRTRKRIALGSARGLSCLHDACNPRIIHRDVKAANILLDEDFEAVVGDFGLAKIMDYNNTHITTDICGTAGHIAPEYLYTGTCSEKTDVFAYGVMLLELITGQSAVELTYLAAADDLLLFDWLKVILRRNKLEELADPDLQGDYSRPEMEQIIKIALLCTQGSPLYRPKMSEVTRMLEGYGLEERFNGWQEVESYDIEMGLCQQPVLLFNPDSTELLSAIELSGPR